MPLEGQHIGHYRLLRQLSESEGYEVYRAEDIHSPAQVIIELARLTDSGYLARRGKQKIHSDRIRHHLETIRASQHPRLVPVREAETTQIGSNNYLYVVTPYFKDGSLEDWWRVRSKTNSLTRQDVDYITQQSTEAVQQLHSCGLAHQKLRLSSFLIQPTDNPDRPHVFLDDFFLAVLRTEELAENELQRTGATAKDQSALQELERLLGSSFREPTYTSVTLQQTDTISDEEIARLRRGIHTPYAEHHQFAYDADDVSTTANAATQLPLRGQAVEQSLETTANDAALSGLPILHEELQQGGHSAEHGDEEEERLRHLREGEEEEKFRRERREREEKKARLRRELRELEDEDELVYERRDKRDDDIKLLAGAILAAAGAGGAATAGSSAATVASAQANSGFFSRRRSWLPIALLLLLLLLVGALCLLASLFFFVKPIWAAGSSSARVTIVQANYELTDSYVFTGMTRSLSQTKTQTIKVAATNVVSTAGIQAGGTLTFHNTQKGCNCPIVIPAGTVFTSAHGVSVVTDQAAILGSLCTVTVPAHALQSGPAGDIAAHDIHQTYLSSILVDNNAAFTGGQFGQSITTVQQSDIEHAAGTLLGPLKQSTLASLQSQLLTNEQFVASPVCTSKVKSNHQAGDSVTSLTVTVSETCQAESYNYQAIATDAQTMLKDRAKALFGSAYALTGAITTTLSHIATDPKQGTLFTVDASGLWTYHFSNTHAGQLARLIAGKNIEDARSILSNQKGVQSVGIDISGDDQKTLPSNAGSISIDYVTTNVPIKGGGMSL